MHFGMDKQSSASFSTKVAVTSTDTSEKISVSNVVEKEAPPTWLTIGGLPMEHSGKSSADPLRQHHTRGHAKRDKPITSPEPLSTESHQQRSHSQSPEAIPLDHPHQFILETRKFSDRTFSHDKDNSNQTAKVYETTFEDSQNVVKVRPLRQAGLISRLTSEIHS